MVAGHQPSKKIKAVHHQVTVCSNTNLYAGVASGGETGRMKTNIAAHWASSPEYLWMCMGWGEGIPGENPL
jgi:hypothetical protein